MFADTMPLPMPTPKPDDSAPKNLYIAPELVIDGAETPVVARTEGLLPGWFNQRMMNKTAKIGLVLGDGKLVAVREIHQVHQDAAGTIWMDLHLLPLEEVPEVWRAGQLLYAGALGQSNIVIRADSVTMAFEFGGVQAAGSP